MVEKNIKILLGLDSLELQIDDGMSQYYIGTIGKVRIKIRHNNKKVFIKNEINQWIFKGWI